MLYENLYRAMENGRHGDWSEPGKRGMYGTGIKASRGSETQEGKEEKENGAMQIKKNHEGEALVQSPMRSEQQMYDLILNFAKSQERVRAVTLEGSRTNRNIPADEFQDYDITFFVTDMDGFTADDAWLDVFGERLILQKPEDMELFPAEEKGYSYLMLFADGVKIDLTLLPLELLEEYFTWDKLVELLLDKDGRVQEPPVPTDVDYRLQCPTARMFDDCCNEFWNTVSYVVKGLCRGEILFAIDHLNEVVRKELLRMISWMTGAERGFGFSVGKNYKFLEQYVSGELWRRLLSTYRMASYPDMWTALEGCMELFREVSKRTACLLGYSYPDYDEKISGYVKRQKERNYADQSGGYAGAYQTNDCEQELLRQNCGSLYG